MPIAAGAKRYGSSLSIVRAAVMWRLAVGGWTWGHGGPGSPRRIWILAGCKEVKEQRSLLGLLLPFPSSFCDGRVCEEWRCCMQARRIISIAHSRRYPDRGDALAGGRECGGDVTGHKTLCANRPPTQMRTNMIDGSQPDGGTGEAFPLDPGICHL